MKLHLPKKPDQDISKRVARTNILGTYVTVLGTILGIMLTYSQLRIAHSAEDRARRTEPLSYTLEAVNTHYQYDIQSNNSTTSLPAPSFRLQVTHGSLHSITAISFDGNKVYQLSSLPIQDRWNHCTVDITMPAQAIIVDGNTVYDYFFLFLEPAEGQCRLDLVYTTIDLDTQQVQSSVLYPVSLIQLNFLDESPKKEMLSVYDTLQKNLTQLAPLKD